MNVSKRCREFVFSVETRLKNSKSEAKTQLNVPETEPLDTLNLLQVFEAVFANKSESPLDERPQSF